MDDIDFSQLVDDAVYVGYFSGDLFKIGEEAFSVSKRR